MLKAAGLQLANIWASRVRSKAIPRATWPPPPQGRGRKEEVVPSPAAPVVAPVAAAVVAVVAVKILVQRTEWPLFFAAKEGDKDCLRKVVAAVVVLMARKCSLRRSGRWRDRVGEGSITGRIG